MLRTVAVALAVAVAGALSDSADAADVRVGGDDTVVYTAAPGELNDVVLSGFEETRLRITDAGASIVPGARCRSLGPGDVVCSPPPAPPVEEDEVPPYMSLDIVRISTGDLDDRVESRGPRLVASGGPGDDAIRGIDLFDVLDGGDGRDRLFRP